MRLRGWLNLVQNCEAIDIALVCVPGDGNCLPWSLRALTLGQEYGSQCHGKRAAEEQCEIRYQLKHMWVSVGHDPGWQVLCQIFNDDARSPPKPAADIHTPEKKKKSGKDEPIDLLTPEHVQSGKKQKMSKVGEGRPAFVAQPQNSQEPVFKHPGSTSKAAQAMLEAPGVDVEEAFSDLQMKVPDPVSSANIEEVDDAMLDGSGSESKKQRRKYHHRQCKSRKPSELQEKKRLLTDLFARHGLTYHRFKGVHQAHSLLKKAACCIEGGFVGFKNRLLAGHKIRCEACLNLLQLHQLSADGSRQAVEEFAADDATTSTQKETGSSQLDTAAGEKLGGDQQDAGKKDDAAEDPLQTCLNYLKEFAPVIEPVTLSDGKLAYRCDACRTRGQPGGKINKLGKPVLDAVKHFLRQHLECPSHVANVRRLADIERLKENTAHEPHETVPCKGYCVSNENSGGELKFFFDDFKRWATHTRLCDRTQHEYTTDFTSDEWFIKHKDCAGHAKIEDGQAPCCPACSGLGDKRKGVLKRVSRFSFKYNAALLLNKKVFRPEAEAEAFLKEIESTPFGQRHSVRWNKICSLQLVQLQRLVRSSWMVNAEQVTPALTLFRESVVQPALQINVSSIDSKMMTVFSGFAAALSSEQLSDPRYDLYNFGMFF